MRREEDAKVQQTLQYISREKERVQERKRMRRREKVSQKKFRQLLKAKSEAIRRLRRQAQKKKRKSDTEVLESVKTYLTSTEIILLKNKMENKRRRSCRYSEDVKAVALSLSYKSTASYKSLAEKLDLPPKRTINRWTSKVRIREGLDSPVFSALEEKVKEMNKEDLFVSMTADEISLREMCNYDQGDDQILGIQRNEKGSIILPSSALVFMINGIRKPWKQTLCYFFSKGPVPGNTLKELVNTCIQKLKRIGITVVNMTSDQGSNFSSLLNQLAIHPGKNFFFSGDQQVFVTPDPPHLIKSCRNALLGHTVVTPDGSCTWKHIQDFYNLDLTQETLRLAPKLTDEHISPPPIYGKMIVRLASQVLSHSVASGLKYHVLSSNLPRSHLATSFFCERMDKIFDLLNSSKKQGKTTFKSGLTPSSAEVLTFIEESLAWLKAMKILDKKGVDITFHFRWIEGLQIALGSVVGLCHHMTARGFDFLLTRRLNQDPLENFFSIIRQRNGFNMNPSCYSFKTAFKILQCN